MHRAADCGETSDSTADGDIGDISVGRVGINNNNNTKVYV